MTPSHPSAVLNQFKTLLAISALMGLCIAVPASASLFQTESSFFSAGYLAKISVLTALISSTTMVALSIKALLSSNTDPLLLNPSGVRIFQMALFALAITLGLFVYKVFSVPATIFATATLSSGTATGLFLARRGTVLNEPLPAPLSVSSLLLGFFIPPCLLAIAGQGVGILLKSNFSAVAIFMLAGAGGQFAAISASSPYWLIGMATVFVFSAITLLVFSMRYIAYRWRSLLPFAGALKGLLLSLGMLSTVILLFVEWAGQRSAASRYWSEKVLSYLLYKMPPGVLWLAVATMVVAGMVVGWKSYRKTAIGAQ